ncbi:MAG: hypothetical protein KF715_10540 [Candidatus Didemnitutus sp.]|nr:hypothetical protein [Candidatus Didemnitutus sp.]
MRSTFRLLVALCLLAPVLTHAGAAPAPYAVGEKLAAFSTRDQHDKPFNYEGGARLVIVSFVMGTGKAANAFFERQPADFLAQHHALFIANIHGMPGIARAFALPKMRKYPHRILLADAEDFLVRYPQQDDRLTVLTLDDSGAITAIRFVDPKKDLPALFVAP